MVRLKVNLYERTMIYTSISIPYGAIKSNKFDGFFRICIHISIPYGAIKSVIIKALSSINQQISIPYGAIKRL